MFAASLTPHDYSPGRWRRIAFCRHACRYRDDIIHFLARPGSETPSYLTVLAIINDGLIVVFFLAVGLEVKYKLLQSALNSRVRAAFPAIAALGGVIYSLVPAIAPALRGGWAIPAVTDIAFAVLALLGTRVPTSLKVFLNGAGDY